MSIVSLTIGTWTITVSWIVAIMVNMTGHPICNPLMPAAYRIARATFVPPVEPVAGYTFCQTQGFLFQALLMLL